VALVSGAVGGAVSVAVGTLIGLLIIPLLDSVSVNERFDKRE